MYVCMYFCMHVCMYVYVRVVCVYTYMSNCNEMQSNKEATPRNWERLTKDLGHLNGCKRNN